MDLIENKSELRSSTFHIATLPVLVEKSGWFDKRNTTQNRDAAWLGMAWARFPANRNDIPSCPRRDTVSAFFLTPRQHIRTFQRHLHCYSLSMPCSSQSSTVDDDVSRWRIHMGSPTAAASWQRQKCPALLLVLNKAGLGGFQNLSNVIPGFEIQDLLCLALFLARCRFAVYSHCTHNERVADSDRFPRVMPRLRPC